MPITDVQQKDIEKYVEEKLHKAVGDCLQMAELLTDNSADALPALVAETLSLAVKFSTVTSNPTNTRATLLKAVADIFDYYIKRKGEFMRGGG